MVKASDVDAYNNSNPMATPIPLMTPSMIVSWPCYKVYKATLESI